MKIKCEAIIEFTLSKFNEITNIIRKNASKEGMLYKGDIFECTKEMAKYLTGENDKKRVVVRIIEVIPKKEKINE